MRPHTPESATALLDNKLIKIIRFCVLCINWHIHHIYYHQHFWNYFHLNLTKSIHSYSTRHNKTLYSTQLKFQYERWLVKFKGSQLWNRVSNDLINITSFELFKKGQKLCLICNPL